MLTALDDNLWEAEFPLRVAGVQLGHRMTVIRLADRQLMLHSPVPLADDLVRELQELGEVRYVVAPSCFHDLFLEPYFERFADATFCSVPGMSDQHPGMGFEVVLYDQFPKHWSEELEHILIGGIPKINEVVFFHPASRTLIVADLVFNIQSSSSWVTRTAMKLNRAYGKVTPSRHFKSFIKDRLAFAACVERILDWDFERIVVGHGSIVESCGRDVMSAAFAWLLEPTGESSA
jgi:hypothetical protein